MPRQATESKIKTKSQRAKLSPRRDPYYTRLSDRLHLGYRRLATPVGVWVIRRRNDDGTYLQSKLAGVTPDDAVAANGVDILTYDQACDMARGTLAKAPDEVTLQAAALEWAKAKQAATDNATRARNYEYTANRIARGFPAGQAVNDLTVKQIEAWRDGHLDGYAGDDLRKRRATANRELATLKAICNGAVTRHRLKIDTPWADVSKFEKTESFGKRVIVLDAFEQARLLAAAENDALRTLIEIAFLTGCRYGELKDARIRDLSGRRLTVRGKTGERTVVLSPAASERLSGLCAGVNNPDRAILLKDNGEPWGDGDQIDPFKRAVAAAGLAPETTLYAARHTYITKHLTAGVPVPALAKQCGTSGEMIEQTYANFLVDDLERWFSLD